MNPKVQSILSYIGVLWLVAFFAGRGERNDLSRYHLKQGLGLLIIALIFNAALGIVLMMIPFMGTILGAVGLAFFIFMGLGIITAANEVKRPLPLIGKMFENKFNFIDT